MVQYQFCGALPDIRDCTSETETAATIQADPGVWLPKMDVLRCFCPHNIFYLQGWRLMGETNAKGQHWHYNYTCYQVSKKHQLWDF